MQIQKTVFISYRRTNSFHALAVYQYLTSLGYDVFYDVDSLRSGDWLQAIIENIKARAHFLIILTPSALERFDEPGDVMRQEIETAIDTQRNIIPLMMENFDFGPAKAHLTGKLAVLPNYNGLEIPARFFKYAMQELHEQRLQQDTRTIIHPISPQAKTLVEEQQRDLEVEPTVTEQDLSAEEYFERGLALSDDSDEEINYYTEAIRLNPQYAIAYYNRGIVRKNKGDLEGAIDDYTEAINSNPQNASAYINRGGALYDKDDLDGAIADYNEAIRLNPLSVNAYLGRGGAYYHKGHMRKAIADYREAIRLNPEYSTTYGNLGEVYFAAKKFVDALSNFKQANELEPASNITLAGLAITNHALGDLQQAKALWGLLLKLDDRYRDADWVGKEHNWHPSLTDEARKLIEGL